MRWTVGLWLAREAASENRSDAPILGGRWIIRHCLNVHQRTSDRLDVAFGYEL
jgi:hypothetical protein